MDNPQDKKDTRKDPPAFELDTRLLLRVDKLLAIQIGELILETDTKNTAILAIGHQLKNLKNSD